MIKGQLFQYINQYLGEYLYGFNQDQLKLGLLSGSLKLRNLTFRPDKINDHLLMMRSPVFLKAGIIGNITIDLNYIDWTKQEIVLEDLLIILGPNFHELKTRNNYVENKENFLKLANKLDDFQKQQGNSNIPEHRRQDMPSFLDRDNEIKRLYKQTTEGGGPRGEQKSKKEAYDTFKQNLPNEKKDIFSILLGLEFLTYLRVVCKRIHIRYEDDQLVPRHPISFGFIIESILLHSQPNMDVFIPASKDSQALGYFNTERKVVEDFWKTSKERKKLDQQLLINNIEVYMNSASEMYVPYSLYENTLKSEQGIFEAIPPLELKELMTQYFTHDDAYKFTVFKIERTEFHYTIASNLKNDKNLRQNFILLNSTIYNVFFDIKPDIIEDILDVVSYFQHFNLWKHLDDFKPNVRPILRGELSNLRNSYPANKQTRQLVLREWWKSILWYLRVKKLVEEGRTEMIPELKEEYAKASLIKRLENWKKDTLGQQDYSASQTPGEFKNASAIQALSKKIFYEDDAKKKNKPNTLELLQKQKVSDMLNKTKDILAMVFCNIYNINVTAKKNNGKNFLVLRIDQSHINLLKNYDWKDSNMATLQVSNIRVFLCQSEKQKKIFEEAAKQGQNTSSTEGSLNKSKQTPLAQQAMLRVIGNDDSKKPNLATSTPLMDNVNRGGTPQQQSTLGTLAVPINAQGQQFNPNTATTQGTAQPSRFGQIFRQPKEGNPPQDPHALQGQVQGQPSSGINLLKTGIEKELQKSAPKHSVDLLLLQLKNDIVCKIEARPSSAQGLLFQTKIEINDIIVNLDPEIVVSIFEYQNEINKIHQIRCAQLKEFGSSYFDELKFEAEKQIITFQNRPRGTLTPQKDKSRYQDSRSMYMQRDSHQNSVPQSEQNFSPILINQPSDRKEIFFMKLSEFLESNEFLVSINVDGLNARLAENSHSSDRRADLANLQVPKGKINLSFNFNRNNTYIVDFYGFRLETSSKFKALYFLYKKVKAIVQSGIEETGARKLNFYEFLVKKGAVRKARLSETPGGTASASATKKRKNIFPPSEKKSMLY